MVQIIGWRHARPYEETPDAIKKTMTTEKTIMLDSEGYIINPEEWNHCVANTLAEREGLELSAEHWLILDFMHQYWMANRVAPDVRHVVSFLVGNNTLDKKAAKSRLFSLFPYGYVQQACKIAGMQRPRAWSTG
ncbi:MAG: TusE/DsrC/DsvC family sulfur relay protein [Kiritimatiellia bacterium]|jgi:TusE/DsrC/DsvC family sulfur relay protein